MDSDNNASNNQNQISQEELDYLYSLYKASQAGTGAKLSKEEIKKLIESDKLTKKTPISNDKNIIKSAAFITHTLYKTIYFEFENEMGTDKWKELDEIKQDQLIWLEFTKRYGMSPMYIKKFFIKLFSLENK